MRVRGLKLIKPFLRRRGGQSHPVRVRGLKLPAWEEGEKEMRSHPVRVRGLKLKLSPYQPQKIQVAPRAGAWIETVEE